MELETKKENDILYVKPLEKRIDASTNTSFKGSIFDLIISGEKLLILDLSQVEFIDSSGLGSLIAILKTLSSSKGALTLCSVNSNIGNLFAVTRMDKVFSIAKNESEAKKTLEEWKEKDA